MLKFIYVTIVILTIKALPLFSEVSLGEKLETEMWENMKHQNYSAIDANIAKEFQSIHTFGALTREGEIQLIKDLNLGSYELSKFKSTENEDTIVVTYLVAAKEKIENQSLSSKPAPRLSVWKKIDDKWQWISHANLKEVPAEKPKAIVPAQKAVDPVKPAH